MSGRSRSLSLGLLLVAEFGAMSLWFVSSAILPDLLRASDAGPWRVGLLSMAVQIGFVIGALTLAIHGTSDRIDPRRVFAVSALAAAAANLALIFTAPGGTAQILSRAVTGMCLAGVYPVGMKIAVGWTLRRRGLVIGALISALAFGSAAPHGLALMGGADWGRTVILASGMAALAGVMILFTGLGPHHARAQAFRPGALWLMWRLRPVRLATAGYLGHMWELYAFWAWIGSALIVSFEAGGRADAETLARSVTFAAIAFGAGLCIPAGALADRIGKARVAGGALALSGSMALATALSFGGPAWLTIALVLAWGMFVVPDSAQFSALVADAAPPESAGSLITLQTALGFLLTVFTIQIAPILATQFGWPATLALFGIGPLVGVEAMRRLIALQRA
ncbi:MFS transporter [Palleronia sp. LCG004]|uniref:MFS transporter n=1 Tax=Palleronia sp. LCG004 TaxID=3079304 RepID=UPI0029420B12|nr:MFS transporter [Palleronia sp. LCG004]WOI57801.1 MFS transporter [Palleronia sp. LCG004]